MSGLGSGEWALYWLPGMRVAEVKPVAEPSTWEGIEGLQTLSPGCSPLMEQEYVQSAVRALVAEGLTFQQAGDVLSKVAAWNDDPHFIGMRDLRRKIFELHSMVDGHLKSGGRLRDLDPKAAEMVFSVVGAETFWPELQQELQDFGPWPKPYGDLVNDLWHTTTNGPALKRLAGAPQ